MKKKIFGILALAMALSLCLLTACGGGDSGKQSSAPSDAGDAGDTGSGGGSDAVTMEITGDAWEVDGIVYHFFEDGLVSTETGDVFSYTWDGSIGEIFDEDMGISAALIYDEDGFFIEGEDEQFYQLTYVGEANIDLLADGENSGDDVFADTIDLVGTAWEMVDEEFQLHFFTNGDATSTEGGPFSYTWDGSYGEISGGGSSLEMIYDEDGFFVEFNDGTYHEFTYIGEADLNLLVENGYYDDDDDDDDDDDGGWGLAGAYDHDDAETSIVFYADGTCAVTNLYDAVEGYYSLDDSNNLYIELDNGESASGWYDASDDTFSLENMDGWFHYTGSASYTP